MDSGFIVLVILLLLGWGLFALIRGMWRLFSAPVSGAPSQRSREMTAEDESYAHDGPYGYSPNTAYPQTQYGSGFDPDAEWAHERDD